jgi:uncharacterized repeat protein (TIGR01451 family)
MKVFLIFFFFFVSSISMLAQQPVSFRAGDMTISVPTVLGAASNNNSVLVLSGKIETEKDSKLFGIIFSKKNKELSQTLIELIDNSSNKIIRNISLEEYFGKESKDWKKIQQECVHTTDKDVTVFSFKALGQGFKFYRIIEIVKSENTPAGKMIQCSVDLKSENPTEIKLRFSGRCLKSISNEGNTLLIGNDLNNKESSSFLVLNFPSTGNLKSLSVKAKNDPINFSYESTPIKIEAGKNSNMLTFNISATTVGVSVHALKQATNLERFFSLQKTNPDLVAITSVDKPSTRAGDTVLTTIQYYNIGTSAAAEVKLDNPIPAGARYIEKSAGGNGSEIDVLRSSSGGATSINWKFAEPIMPGEERKVFFKMVIL